MSIDSHFFKTRTALSQEAVQEFRNKVGSTFATLKDAENIKSVLKLDGYGALVAITHADANDKDLITDLSIWRKNNNFAFPSQLEVTEASTHEWIRNKVLAIPDRLLFLIVDANEQRIGHMGFANAFNDDCFLEVDNVIRGTSGKAGGIMAAALKALTDWARDRFEPQAIFLRVLEDNKHAIEFYSRCGFSPVDFLPTDGPPTSESSQQNYLRMVLEVQ